MSSIARSRSCTHKESGKGNFTKNQKEARIKNRQLKCRQEDDLADDLSNPSYGSARRNFLDDFTDRVLMEKLEEGRSLTNVGEEFGTIKRVFRAWNSFQAIGVVIRKVVSSNPKKTTAFDERYIAL
ncbi:hypothetical protein TNCV_1021601 [Trichonephila clavipes]|uniref:Uncharacterized protein n=1 Tax=Trichonephila clavipes TaxID=2585209 RepID=A0A8X6SMP3_TRICX|nr:hypothetical protein TNCV_1021601 [Trichonephila clavipes]